MLCNSVIYSPHSFKPTAAPRQRQSHVHLSARCNCRESSTATTAVERFCKWSGASAAALAFSASVLVSGVDARLEGVNRPDLLPKEDTPLIDVAGFLTPGEENRLKVELRNMEKDTGIKLRVLAQNYPETPGLAVKDFWAVDDNTVVMVADPGLGGNILNFNVGANVDLQIPRNFWSRLSGKYGNKFWWQEKGQEAAIVNAVSAIDTCFREPIGKLQCTKIQEPFDADVADTKQKGMFGF